MPASGFRSLKSRLIFWMMLLVGSISGLMLLLSSRVSREWASLAAEREAVRATEAAVNRAQEVLSSVEEGTRVLSATLESARLTDAQLQGLLQRFVTENPYVYGSAAAFEPGAFDASRKRFSPYLHRTGVGSPDLKRTDLATASYRYWERDWYLRPAVSRSPSWSEPYFDEGGGQVLMVTYSVPVLAGPEGGALLGVVTADVHLQWLARLTGEFRVGRSGFAVLVSREGRLLAHPDLPELGSAPLGRLDPSLRERTALIVQRIMSGRKGFEPLAFDGKQYRLTYALVGSSGWSLAALYPEEELMEGARHLATVQAAIACAGLVAVALAVVALSRRLTTPLRELADRAHLLAAGDLDLPLPEVRSRDELGALIGAFRHMRDSLKKHIRELQEATALRERHESELRVARRIQMALLPARDAGGPGAGYSLAACLEPARAVGGDLFDHFLLKGKVYFFAADVSGKGIPAALFMARAKTIFEAVAATEPDPAAILARVNQVLLKENEEGMYVTGVCGVLDILSGDVSLAVAGHDPPFLVGSEVPPAPLKIDGGPVLGLMSEAAFPTNRVRLHPGEQLVIYTDGVPDARDKSDEFYATERLQQAIAHWAAGGAHAVTAGVLESVRVFVGGAAQADDITILTVQYRPPGVGERPT